MKKTENISEEKSFGILMRSMLTVALMVMLCTPYLASTSSAEGNMTGNYQGMAYLAEQEIRTQELQAKAAEEAELVADAAVTDEEKNAEEATQDDK